MMHLLEEVVNPLVERSTASPESIFMFCAVLQWILHDPQGCRTPIVADGSKYADMTGSDR
jgi:hypothetical protein